MHEPVRLPIRILVKGASTVNYVSWMGGPRQDFIFPRVIEEQLIAAARPVEMRTITMTSERTSTILGTWQAEVLGFSPDVVVLVYGHYETIHLFTPRWLEVHANSLRSRPRLLATAYRKYLLRPGWRALMQVQAKVDSILSPTLRRGRPRQVAADLERYIAHIQTVGSPLVYVFELLPPGTRYRTWFPGMARRIEVMNHTLKAMVDRIGRDNVRYFEVAGLVKERVDGDIDIAIPDGFHYSPQMHRVIGTALACEIDEWAQTQTHLTTRDNGR